MNFMLPALNGMVSFIEDEANPNKHQDAGEHQEDDRDHQEAKRI